MEPKSRRDVLRSGWKLGGALLVGAAGYTGYEALRPLTSSAHGAKITVGTVSSFPPESTTYVPAGRMYMVNTQGYLFALSQKCPHLGCHVPYCKSSGRFECPCHGSVYDLAGEYIAGPAPRGMDRYHVTLQGEHVVVDTNALSERPEPPPFEPEWLERSLDRYLVAGLVFMVLLLAGFVAYRVREPSLRTTALHAQTASYRSIGHQLFAQDCAQCHGKDANGGGSAPTLNSSQFLKNTSDDQIVALVSGGVSGTEMPPWSLDYGGTLTAEQVRQLTTYLRSLEGTAPSIPNWRQSAKAS
jgi:mono/diheme cytochrome c family protein/nitrite reductase/ring-hydroxylating ferredoxin subunit